MTLRQRLALHYGALLLVVMSLATGLTYHEVVTERRLRQLISPTDEAEVQQRKFFDVAVFSVVPAIVFAGWWLVRRSLQPLSVLAKTVEHTGIDTLHEPLPRSGNGDEVDRLTAAFNVMSKRLNESFQQIREFTLHASHELKTPLTVMRGELETALQQEETYTPLQRECLHTLLDEVHRLSSIVNALTLLTKADAGQVHLERQPVRLAELVRESFEDARILADARSVRVRLAECADLTIMGDRHRLRQLLLNLVDNAVKYNCTGGDVTMALRQANGSAEFEIANTGAGIPPALRARVFDRFVRGDEARAQAIEGCGLGLTIAQWITEAHGGTVRIESEPGLVTSATVRLPLLVSH